MDNLKKNLEHREKPELIAIIQHMLRQEPDLEWLLTTPLPIAASREVSIDPKIYQRQVVAAMSVNDNQLCRTGTVCCGSHHLRSADHRGHCTLQ